VELDAGSLGSVGLVDEVEFGGLGVTQQTHHDAHARHGQIIQFVSEPVAAPRPRHRAEASAPPATDREQIWSHVPPSFECDVFAPSIIIRRTEHRGSAEAGGQDSRNVHASLTTTVDARFCRCPVSAYADVRAGA